MGISSATGGGLHPTIREKAPFLQGQPNLVRDDRQRGPGDVLVLQVATRLCPCNRRLLPLVDARPESAVLQVKLRVVKLHWPIQVAESVDAYLAAKLP